MPRPALIEKLMQPAKWLFKKELIPLDDLAGSGLTALANRLNVDFSEMPEDKMRQIVLLMILENGGLAVDENGKLYVDFSRMSTERFEAMLAELHVPIWVSDPGKPTDFYVDISVPENDPSRTGKKGSSTNPFVTISEALQTVCNNYNIVNQTVTIHVASGEYVENIHIGKFSVTTGRIVIEGPPGISVQIKGYVWANGAGPITFKYITFSNIPENCYGSSYTYLLTAMNGSNITLNNCRMEHSVAVTSAGLQCLRVLSGSSVVLEGGAASASDPGFKLFPYLEDGLSSFYYINNGQVSQNCNCHVVGLGVTANFSAAFAQVTNLGVFTLARNADWTSWPIWTGGNNASGKRYDISMNSVANVRGGGPNFFPGNADGTTTTGGQYS